MIMLHMYFDMFSKKLHGSIDMVDDTREIRIYVYAILPRKTTVACAIAPCSTDVPGNVCDCTRKTYCSALHWKKIFTDNWRRSLFVWLCEVQRITKNHESLFFIWADYSNAYWFFLFKDSCFILIRCSCLRLYKRLRGFIEEFSLFIEMMENVLFCCLVALQSAIAHGLEWVGWIYTVH